MKKSILYSIIIFPITAILLVAILVDKFNSENIKKIEKIYSSQLSSLHNEYNKNNIHNIVKSIQHSINYNTQYIERILKLEIKHKIEMALKLVNDIYTIQSNEKTKEKIKSLVIETIKKLNNESSYFFIIDTKTNIMLYHPIEKLIGKDFTNYKDVNGQSNLLNLKSQLNDFDVVYDKTYFYKDKNTNDKYLKLNGVIGFSKLDILIGTGVFLDSVNKKLQDEEVFKIRTISSKNEIKVNIFKPINNNKYENLIINQNINQELEDIINQVKQKGQGFYQYNENMKKKYSYFYYHENWDWIIECGYYTDKIEKIFNSLQKEMNREISNSKTKTNILLFFIVLFALIISSYILYTIKKIITKYNHKINEYVNIVDKNVITSSTDLHGNITYVSDAFCKISGYSKKELIGKNHSIIRHPDMDKKIYTNLWETILQDRVWQGELKNIKKNKDCYWVEATIHPIYEGNIKIGYTAIRQDITHKKKLEELSITDGLTKLYNRRYFDETFPQSLNTAKRNRDYFAFLLLDIDYFKQYNDTYGHQMGDNTLKEVSNCLKRNFKRSNDFIFRVGGEEFGIILEVDLPEKILEYTETLRKEIEDLQIEHKNNLASKYVTVSFGLICGKAEELPSFKDIYNEADKLLYQSKQNGRNCISYKFN